MITSKNIKIKKPGECDKACAYLKEMNEAIVEIMKLTGQKHFFANANWKIDLLNAVRRIAARQFLASEKDMDEIMLVFEELNITTNETEQKTLIFKSARDLFDHLTRMSVLPKSRFHIDGNKVIVLFVGKSDEDDLVDILMNDQGVKPGKVKRRDKAPEK